MGENNQEHTIRIRKRRQRRNTLILAGVLAAVFSVLFAVRKRPAPEPGLVAVIQVSGQTIHTMNLEKDEEYRVLDADGHYNTVVVEDGCVLVRDADCANQICVKTGKIRFPGEVIACLPHRLIITIEDEE